MKHSKNKYDGMVVFETPILITDQTDEKHFIYGLLYNKDEMHKNDLWTWEINRFIAYLLGCQRMTENGGELTTDAWLSSCGKIIPLTPAAKNFIYKLEKKELPRYTIDETSPIELSDGNHEGEFLLTNPYVNSHSAPTTAEGHIKLTEILPTIAEYNEIRDKSNEKVNVKTDNEGIPNKCEVTECFNLHTVLPYHQWVSENFQKRPPQDPDYDDRPKGWRDDDDEEEEE